MLSTQIGRALSVVGLAFTLVSPLQAQEPKDQPSSGESVAALQGGGSDAFGYTVSDCGYDFVDISTTGTLIVSGDDAGDSVTLAEAFDFYGTSVTDMALTTNGYLSTDSTDSGGDLSNDCPLPEVPSSGGGARIYPLQDDLVGDGYYEYFASCPRPSTEFPGADLGCHVFQWVDMTHFGGSDTWTFQALLYDQSWEIVFQHGPGNPETGSESTTGIQNAAADIGLTYACDTAGSVPDESAQCIAHPQPALPDLAVSQVDAPDPVVAGESVTWTVTVENVGSEIAPNVVATNTLPAGVSLVETVGCVEDPTGEPTCSLGDIPVGDSLSYDVVVDVDPSTTGTLTHSVSVESDGTDADPSNNASDEDTTVVAEADMSITKTGDATAIAGEQATYTIEVVNDGPSDAQDVSVSDTPPAGFSFSSATAPCAGGFPCDLGTVAVGDSVSFDVTFDIAPDVTGDATNTASVSTAASDPDGGNDSDSATTTVSAEADLAIAKSDNADPVAGGSQLIYTVQVDNTGPSDATGVVVSDTLPADVTLVETIGCDEDPNGVPDCTLGDLAAGTGTSFDIVVEVDLLFSGTLTNTADVSSQTTDPNGANDSASEDTEVTAAESDLVLTLSNDGASSEGPGAVFDITMDLVNDGPQDNVNVTVSGTLDGGLQFESSSCATAAGNDITWSVGSLDSGASASCVMTVSTGFGPGEKTFTASASGDVDDPQPDNNTDQVTGVTVVVPIPTLDTWALLLLVLGMTVLATSVLVRR